jgi:pimeloyl-ACP methyl ester carboxylesterase
VTIDQCVDAVIADADAAGIEQMVLVGHSMGGITITEVANRHPDRISHLIYLAALILAPGETVFDLYPPWVDDPAGVMPLLDETVAHQLFSEDLAPEVFAVAHAQCVPEPVGLHAATVTGYDSGIPATYVRCLRDRAISADNIERMIERLHPVAVHEFDADHDIMLSQPDVVTDVCNRVAAQVSST